MPVDFENALDNEHDVRPTGIILIENQRDIVLIGPWQDSFAEFSDLLALFQDDRVLADQVDAADVAVEIDADARPVEAGGDLLDMGRFAGAMITGDHHAAVIRKAGENRERRLAIEQIVLVEIGHMLARLGIGGHFETGIEAEELAHRHFHVRQGSGFAIGHRIHRGRHFVIREVYDVRRACRRSQGAGQAWPLMRPGR